MRPLPLIHSALLISTCLTACGGGSPAPTGVPDGGTQKHSPPPPIPAPTSVIEVSPTSLSFLVYAFRPSYNPPAKTLTITNLGSAAPTWTAQDHGYWLSLNIAAGTAPSSVAVRVSRAAIPIGLNGYRPSSLNATITVSGGSPSTTITIPVLLSISYVRP